MLENSRDTSISGERIAGLTSVSRNAVWKAIKELRKDGYEITAVTNKGYRLSGASDIISVQGISAHLRPNVRAYAEQIHVYQVLESTNKTAKELAIDGAKHGTIVIAEQQTLGRGRYSRSFCSPEGGLYISFVLRPERLGFQNATAITAFAAVAVCEAIESVTNLSPKIKWGNDIFIDGKKVCGILTEAITDFESGNLSWIVLGIGINVNTRAEDFPHDLREIAGSLSGNERPNISRNRLAAELIDCLFACNASDEKSVFSTYKKRLMMLGQTIRVKQAQHEFPAKAIDIDDAGHLVVETANGELLNLSSGEISIDT